MLNNVVLELVFEFVVQLKQLALLLLFPQVLMLHLLHVLHYLVVLRLQSLDIILQLLEFLDPRHLLSVLGVSLLGFNHHLMLQHVYLILQKDYFFLLQSNFLLCHTRLFHLA